MAISELDDAIKSSFPVLPAPCDGTPDEPPTYGIRFIVARSGLMRELTTPWLKVVRRVAAMQPTGHGEAHSTPYGELQESVRMTCNDPPLSVWSEFMAHAREQFPNEAAGLVLWNQVSRTWRLALRQATFVSPSRIDYVEPAQDDDEIAVIDVHSHGRHQAGFSVRDDRDDQGGIKIAVVFGRVDTQRPEVAARLICLDHMVALRMTASGGFEVKEDQS